MQFQVYGAPFLPKTDFSFTPKPNEGAKYPKHKNNVCYGKDLRNTVKMSLLNLEWRSNAYQLSTDKDAFFNAFFINLAGTKKLQQQIENKVSHEEIRKSWLEGFNRYEEMRRPYLLY